MSNFASVYNSVVKKVDAFIGSHFRPIEGFDTKATHGGYNPSDLSELGRPVVAPISLASTFHQLEAGQGKYIYSRGGNYTRDALEKCIVGLEQGGSDCCTYASGLAALGAVVQTLPTGSHILTYEGLYAGTWRYFARLAPNAGLSHTLVDATNLELFANGLRPNTRLVMLESPTNPTMHVLDIEAIVKLTRAFTSARGLPDIIVMVDNTFMTPYFQSPLKLGVDVVLYSLTKYINGHSDVIMGALVTSPKGKELASKLRFNQLAGGAVPSPFDCYQCLRGIRTLGVRMRTHMRSGLIVAKMLEQHHGVDSVRHPALPSHPQHELALKQMRGFCGMLSFYVKGSGERAKQFVKRVKLFSLGESLGGFESLMEIPSLMTHSYVDAEIRAKTGVTDDFIRLSIGLEDPKDLIQSLYEALDVTANIK